MTRSRGQSAPPSFAARRCAPVNDSSEAQQATPVSALEGISKAPKQVADDYSPTGDQTAADEALTPSTACEGITPKMTWADLSGLSETGSTIDDDERSSASSEGTLSESVKSSIKAEGSEKGERPSSCPSCGAGVEAQYRFCPCCCYQLRQDDQGPSKKLAVSQIRPFYPVSAPMYHPWYGGAWGGESYW